MSARRKLNSMYLTGVVVLAGFIGLGFQSWWAFAIILAFLVVLNVEAGNIRLTPARR